MTRSHARGEQRGVRARIHGTFVSSQGVYAQLLFNVGGIEGWAGAMNATDGYDVPNQVAEENEGAAGTREAGGDVSVRHVVFDVGLVPDGQVNPTRFVVYRLDAVALTLIVCHIHKYIECCQRSLGIVLPTSFCPSASCCLKQSTM